MLKLGAILAASVLLGCSSPSASLARKHRAQAEAPGRIGDPELDAVMADARANEIDWWKRYCEPEPAPGFVCLEGGEAPEQPKGRRFRNAYRMARSEKKDGKWTTLHRLVLEETGGERK